MSKRRMRVVFFGVVCLVVFSFTWVIFAAGEKGGKEAKANIIVYIPQVGFAGETSIAHYNGAYYTAKKYGYEFVMGDPNFDPATQVNMLEDYVSEAKTTGNIAGIVFQPVDRKLSIAAVKKVNEAGIPIIIFDTDLEGGCEALAIVKTSLEEEGRQAGNYLIELLEQKYGAPRGTVLGILGPLGGPASSGRTAGFREIIDQYAGVKVIEKPTDWQIPKAESAARDVLTANPNIDAIYSASDYLSEGIESGMHTAGKVIPSGEKGHVFWVSIDGMGIGLERIRRGIMDFTSSGNFHVQTIIATKMLIEYISEGKAPKVGDVINGDYIEDEHAYWAPAEVISHPVGPLVNLMPYPIDLSNVDDPNLWGNIKWEAPKE
jgi:ABC-type sugar transport system substrate-binding protein